MDALSITSLIYIRDYDLIGFRSVNSDKIQLAQMQRIMTKFDASKSDCKKPIALPFWPGAKLQYKINKIESDLIEFIEMTCNGHIIACGDACGNIYVYECNQSLNSRGIIQAIQIITYQKYPKPPVSH